MFTRRLRHCSSQSPSSGVHASHYKQAWPRSAVGRAPDSRARGPGFDTRSGHIHSFLIPLIQEGQLSVTDVSMCILVNRLGGLNLPRKSVVRLTDRPDMTIAVYHGRKTTTQQYYKQRYSLSMHRLNHLRRKRNLSTKQGLLNGKRQ